MTRQAMAWAFSRSSATGRCGLMVGSRWLPSTKRRQPFFRVVASRANEKVAVRVSAVSGPVCAIVLQQTVSHIAMIDNIGKITVRWMTSSVHMHVVVLVGSCVDASYSMRGRRARRTPRHSWLAFSRVAGRSLCAHSTSEQISAHRRIDQTIGREVGGSGVVVLATLRSSLFHSLTNAELFRIEQLCGDGRCSLLVQVVLQRRMVHAGQHSGRQAADTASAWTRSI